MIIESFLSNLVILLDLTLIAGILPLIERKYLSLTQRRVGPDYAGYKGRMQFVIDAIKIFLKQCALPLKNNPHLLFLGPAAVLSACYMTYITVFWSTNQTYFDIEYNLLYLTLLSYIFNFYVILTGLSVNNKYSTIAALRTVVLMYCLELLLGLLYLNFYLFWKSFNFSLILTFQQEFSSIFIFFGIYSVIIIIIFLDINRCPYDLNEAESELIAGFHIEFGSFFFGLFYLSEYFHLFFYSILFLTLFIGL